MRRVTQTSGHVVGVRSERRRQAIIAVQRHHYCGCYVGTMKPRLLPPVQMVDVDHWRAEGVVGMLAVSATKLEFCEVALSELEG